MTLPRAILERIRRGRLFEQKERREWTPEKSGRPSRTAFEAASLFGHRRGRIDIRLEWEDLIVLLELKSTDWNRLRPHRIRTTALRHIAQLYRYVDGELKKGNAGICHGIVYERRPRLAARRQQLAEIFDERCVQLVFRDER